MRFFRSSFCSSRGFLSECRGQAPRRTLRAALQPTIAAVRHTSDSMPSRQGEIVRNLAVAPLPDAPLLHEFPRIEHLHRTFECGGVNCCLWCRLKIGFKHVARFLFIRCLLSRPTRHNNFDGIRCGISSSRASLPVPYSYLVHPDLHRIRWTSVGLVTCERLRGIHLKHDETNECRNVNDIAIFTMT